MPRIVGLLATGWLVVSCGAGRPPLVDAPEHDYDKWWPNAKRLASAEKARQAVGLPIVVPRVLGEPRCICFMVHAVAFVHDSPGFGRVVVAEGPVDYTDPEQQREGYENAVAGNDNPANHGTAEMVTVKGNVLGLLTTREDGSRSGLEIVLWGSEGNVQFYITGPALSREQALAIANDHL